MRSAGGTGESEITSTSAGPLRRFFSISVFLLISDFSLLFVNPEMRGYKLPVSNEISVK